MSWRAASRSASSAISWLTRSRSDEVADGVIASETLGELVTQRLDAIDEIVFHHPGLFQPLEQGGQRFLRTGMVLAFVAVLQARYRIGKFGLRVANLVQQPEQAVFLVHQRTLVALLVELFEQHHLVADLVVGEISHLEITVDRLAHIERKRVKAGDVGVYDRLDRGDQFLGATLAALDAIDELAVQISQVCLLRDLPRRLRATDQIDRGLGRIHRGFRHPRAQELAHARSRFRRACFLQTGCQALEALARRRIRLHQHHRMLEADRRDHRAIGAHVAEPFQIELQVFADRLRETLVDALRGILAFGHIDEHFYSPCVLVAFQHPRQGKRIRERGRVG